MPDIEKRYGTKITAVGAARITACVLAGTKLKITQAAAGDGGDAGADFQQRGQIHGFPPVRCSFYRIAHVFYYPPYYIFTRISRS